MENHTELLEKSLKDAARLYPGINVILQDRQGPEYEAIAPYLTLGKALERWDINEELFFRNLESMEKKEEEQEDEYNVKDSFPPFVALLPCGLRNPFSRLFDSFIEEWGQKQESLIEGNVNHELSYYEYVESINDPDALPDLMITSDINTLFHKRFQEKFINTGLFLPPEKPVNPLFERSGMVDPENRFSFLATNLLVMAVDLEKLGDRPLPSRWEDLLDPAFSRSVGVRGEEDFFCHSVSIPYYLLYGKEGLENLAENIAACYHPSEMVKLCNSPQPDSPPAYILPWFFAQRITRTDRVKLIFPEEGCFTSPISLFVKREKASAFKEILDFLSGEKLAQLCEELWFPSTFSTHSPEFPEDKKLYWIGWDTVWKGDIAQLKQTIDTIYESALDKKRRKELTGRDGS